MTARRLAMPALPSVASVPPIPLPPPPPAGFNRRAAMLGSLTAALAGSVVEAATATRPPSPDAELLWRIAVYNDLEGDWRRAINAGPDDLEAEREYDARVVKPIEQRLGGMYLRARAKAIGQHGMTHERRCARLVLQGVLSRREAEDAMTLLLCGIYKVEVPDAFWLAQAGQRLRRAMEQAQIERHRCEREIKAACQAGIVSRAPSLGMLMQARSINEAHGHPFVWPEICGIVSGELAWAMRRGTRRFAGARARA